MNCLIKNRSRFTYIPVTSFVFLDLFETIIQRVSVKWQHQLYDALQTLNNNRNLENNGSKPVKIEFPDAKKRFTLYAGNISFSRAIYIETTTQHSMNVK